METKIVTLCGVQMTLYKRKCGGCDEVGWYNADVFVCNDCSEVYIPPQAERPDRIRASEATYHGDRLGTDA